MKNQLDHWNNAHKNQWLHAHSHRPTAFAEEVLALLPQPAAILELGCGEGNDSSFFAAAGHQVTATDFSNVAVDQNRQRWNDLPDLHFAIQDMTQPLAFDDAKFDLVYARLSLHYFTDAISRQLFKHISRVLKTGGRLAFMCKEVHDPIYGRGEEIEADMFELDGHVRHFFSEDYARRLTAQAGLTIETLEVGLEKIYDRESAFIKVVAIKE